VALLAYSRLAGPKAHGDLPLFSAHRANKHV
jgi:hypothetical protein